MIQTRIAHDTTTYYLVRVERAPPLVHCFSCSSIWICHFQRSKKGYPNVCKLCNQLINFTLSNQSQKMKAMEP